MASNRRNTKRKEIRKKRIKAAISAPGEYILSGLKSKTLRTLVLTLALSYGPHIYANAPDIPGLGNQNQSPKVEQASIMPTGDQAGVNDIEERHVPQPTYDGLNNVRPECIKIVQAAIEYLEGSDYSSYGANKDGAGISFGLFQWNSKSGSLQYLLGTIDAKYPGLMERIFKENYPVIKNLYEIHKGESESMARARQLSLSRQIAKDENIEEEFIALGQTPECKREEDLFTQPYMEEAAGKCCDYNLQSLEALVLLTNLNVHTGYKCLESVTYLKHSDMSERDKLIKIGDAAVDSVDDQYKDLVRRRVRAILYDENVRINGELVNLKDTFGINKDSFYKPDEPNKISFVEKDKLTKQVLGLFAGRSGKTKGIDKNNKKDIKDNRCIDLV